MKHLTITLALAAAFSGAQAAPGFPLLASETELTAAEIAAIPATNVAQLLKTLGVEVREDAGPLGFDSRVSTVKLVDPDTVILLNGTRITGSGGFAGAVLSTIPVDSIERIELARQHAGTLISGAAGVVNIVTKTQESNGFAGAAFSGSDGYSRQSGSAFADGIGRAAAIHASHDKAHGDFGGQRQENTAVVGTSALQLAPGHAVGLNFAAARGQDRHPGAMSNGAMPNPVETAREHSLFSASYVFDPSEDLSISSTFSASDVARRRHNVSAFGGTFVDRQKRAEGDLRASKLYSVAGLESQLDFGVGYSQERAESLSLPFVSQARDMRTQSSIFVMNTAQVGAIRATVSGRADQTNIRVPVSGVGVAYDTRKNTTHAEAGVAYAGDGYTLHARVARGSNPPTAYDLYLAPQLIALTPKTKLKEIGASAELPVGVLQVNFAQESSKDTIRYEASTFGYVPAGKREKDILELVYRIDAGALSARLSYAAIDARQADGVHAGKRIPGVADERASAVVSYNAGVARYSAVVNSVGSRVFTYDYGNINGPQGGYTTVDLQIEIPVAKGVTVVAQMMNATNKKRTDNSEYIDGSGWFPSSVSTEPLPDRFTSVGIRAVF